MADTMPAYTEPHRRMAVVMVPRSRVHMLLKQREVAALFLRGIEAASKDDVRAVIRDLFEGVSQVWIVAAADVPDTPLAVFLTQTKEDRDGTRWVCLWGLAGDDVRRWAGPVSACIARYAKAQGCKCFRFAGKRGWGRLLPETREVGAERGMTVFERMAR